MSTDFVTWSVFWCISLRWSVPLKLSLKPHSKTYLTAALAHNKVYLQILECYQVENVMANRPMSTHILFYFNIYNFSLKWHNIIIITGNGHRDIIDYKAQ